MSSRLILFFCALVLAASPAAARDRDSPFKIPSDAQGRRRILPVPQHYQSTAVWCWAASIAMANEYFYKKPINDCEVTSKVDLKSGGKGKCCMESGFVDRHCYKGARSDRLAEVSEFYFHLHVTEVHRSLSWDELMSEIDAGHPFIAGLWLGEGMGHAVVVAGYAAPDYVFIDDPWNGRVIAHYDMLKGGHGHNGFWHMTWELAPTDRTVFSATAAMPPPLAQASDGPAKATVTVTVPTIPEGSRRTAVEDRIAKQSDALRACYEQGMQESPPVAPTASATVSFALDHGSPMWLRVKSATGLTANATKCLTDTIARWTGLYPSGSYDESQAIHLEFAALAPPPALASPGATPSGTSGAAADMARPAAVGR